MRYRSVIFDLDGTLLDTLDDLGAAVNYALQKRGMPLHTREEYATMVGGGVRKLVERAIEAGGVVDECLSDFMGYYTTHIDVFTHPYPGIVELLTELQDHGISLAIASNKFQEGADYLANKMFPGIRFTAVLGERPGAPLKPDPAIVGEVLRLSGIPREQTVFVGDSPTDMATARNGDVDPIAVTWGYGAPQAEMVAGSVADLRALLGRNDKRGYLLKARV